ncbi:hypothetical protein [Rickettsiales endosymbiont of Stachyamoeba lipophora]|uniref:hypothetical protein n=1 Tax=Rickettsiales endosymbiont of Stachyamoeba lipophora TaxID=2486578 RepID=UPI000F64F4DF|nr:hypothetical protein [Rickettsiales endosymbiont of Stachyamoeba lipophora]AZL16060.1 hypothetical protein EF513_05870 [Rickettsiales endosymbiont of Stachyamoeba lipophora]
MWWFKKSLLLSIIVLSVTSCGFKPLYAKNQTNMDQDYACLLAQIELLEPATQEAQAVYVPLHDMLCNYCNRDVTNKYRLNFHVAKYTKPVLVFRTGDATRRNVVIKVDFTLIDLVTHEILLKGVVRNSSGYNTLDSPFTEFISLTDAIHNTSKQNAQDIMFRINNYFKNQ